MEEKSLEERVLDLEETLQGVLERNQRVEIEKRWEQSTTRIIGVVVLTYILMCIVFYMIGSEHFMMNAIIPTLGYYLSTQSLSVLKSRWIRRLKRD